jgi:hypothetical protein
MWHDATAWINRIHEVGLFDQNRFGFSTETAGYTVTTQATLLGVRGWETG